MNKQEPFSAVLLAGGRSRRMGQDKAFLEFGEPPVLLWKRQLDLLRSLGPAQLLLSQNADQKFDAGSDVETVIDALTDLGPLGGLATCLRRCENRRLVVLAVDLPFASEEFLRSMLAGPGGVVLHDETVDRYEAVVGVYTKECLKLAEECLLAGKLAMQSFIATALDAGLLNSRPITDAERAMLRNLNRPEDLSDR